jgi:acetylornithine deacetylase/succinyl-diaminopimelate desuccinylase-like protein
VTHAAAGSGPPRWGGRPWPPGAQRRWLQAHSPAAPGRPPTAVATSAIAVFFLAAVRLPAIASDIDWADVERQATAFLSTYIQIDTTNPPGNESAAAQFLAARFRQAGIDAETFESAPGRGSVMARLKGSGGGRPVILLNHLDVVPANPDGWDVPPFSGTVRDGYVYGRGALDCKGVGTVDAFALLLLKQHGITLKRDVIFLGTADEETGGKLGAGWMVDHHLERFADVEFVLNEGGAIETLPNGRQAYGVAVAEKTPCWLKLTTTGRPGHGSAPPKETAVTRLLRALDHVRDYRPALRMTPEVEAYYAALAPLQNDAKRQQYTHLRRALQNQKFRAEFVDRAHDAALVHNTITPTVLTGSLKTNVIPRTASAELDCRLLPGESPDTFISTIRRVVNDPDVSIDVLLNFPPSASPTKTHLYAALQQLAEREHQLVVPSVLTGFTDSHYFREQGITSYGFVPFTLSEDEGSREHGVNERLSTENLREGTRRLLELLHILDETAADGRKEPRG